MDGLGFNLDNWVGLCENHDPKTISFLDESLNMVPKMGMFTVFHPNH
jgi:hypothetical protein